MILDAGFLISVDRGDEAARSFLEAAKRAGRALHTTHPVVAQGWRNGARQARLARLLSSAVTTHALDNGVAVGLILEASGTNDVVAAHLVITALRLGHDVLTGDVSDIGHLAKVVGPTAPTVHAWP